MDTNRKILIAIGVVLLFAIGVIIWFLLYSTTGTTSTLGEPLDPLAVKSRPRGFQFIHSNTDEQPVTESFTEITPEQPQVLTEIWKKPATGQVFVEQSITREIDASSTQGTSTVSIKKLVRATSTTLLFVDRITGYVYGYHRDTGKVYQISNSTYPGIYDAYIFNNGKRIILRFADNEKHVIVGVLATIPTVNENEQPRPLENTTFLPSQVTSVAVNNKNTLVSYLVTGDNGASIYTISAKGTAHVANTPFKEWLLSYGGDQLYASSKPSAYIEGQTVLVPTFEFIVGQKTGIMSNPSENNYLLNSMWSSSGLRTFLTHGANQVVLSISTLAPKCAWGRKDFLVCAVPQTLPRKIEGLPDDWFQGAVSFSDSLKTVDIKSAEAYPLYTFDQSKGLTFDVTNMNISPDNTLIIFNRKQNASLWLLDTTLITAE